MSRTRHHKKILPFEAHKNRAAGYEYWSKRYLYPLSPGRISKIKTKRKERSSQRKLLFLEKYREENV